MAILSTLIEISIYSAVLLLVILLFKKVLHNKLSASVQFALWSLFVLRLLMPFSIDSGLHLVTYTEPTLPVAQVEDTAPTTNTHQEHSDIPMTFSNQPELLPTDTQTIDQSNAVVGQDYESLQRPKISAAPTPLSLSIADIVIIVWLTGLLGCLIFMSISYIKLRKRIITRSTTLIPPKVTALIHQCEQRMNVKRPCEVRISDDFGSTVLLAALRPKLIIPAHMLDNPVVLDHSLLHEFAHYRCRDYLTYLLTNLLCAVYWFNPCVWIGTRLMKQDMESACDALVIKTMTDDERDQYARTLLSMFSNQPKRFQIAMGMGNATKKEAEKRIRGVYMKRKTSIKTKLTVIVLALIMLMTCFTTACQPMEAESIEQDKTIATDTPSTTAIALPFNQGEIPKHWTETVKYGKLTINIDTDIKAPDTEQYPVVRVEPVVFSQERVDELINYFAEGKKLYEWPRAMIKADYEKELIEARKGDYIDYEYVITEDSKKHVAELEQKKADAPVEAPKIYTDTTLTAGNNPSIYTSSNLNSLVVAVENENHDDAVIHVHNYSSGQNNETYFRYSKGNGYQTESWINQMIEEAQVFLNPDDQKALIHYSKLIKILNNVQLSAEQLKPYAEKILTDFNIQDMQLVNAEKAVLNSWNNYRGLDAGTPDQGGYVFEYIRQSGGIPGLQKASFSGPDKNSPKYTPPFMQEQVTVFVTEDGVQEFTWSGCAKVVETVSENVELLPFKRIQQALTDQIYNKQYHALDEGSTITMNVNAGELRMGYINTGKHGEALMVPIWIFHISEVEQKLNHETGEITTYEYNPDAITINALDGGVIDHG